MVNEKYKLKSHLSKQCAAVNPQSLLIIEAPQGPAKLVDFLPVCMYN